MQTIERMMHRQGLGFYAVAVLCFAAFYSLTFLFLLLGE